MVMVKEMKWIFKQFIYLEKYSLITIYHQYCKFCHSQECNHDDVTNIQYTVIPMDIAIWQQI